MSDHTDGSRAMRAARNQDLYRSVNERVKEMNEAFDALLPLGEWVCECANVDCFETVRLTHEEYEAIRAAASRFFVAPDDAHVVPEAEAILDRHERYWVVEKIGAAGAFVRQRDPRAAR